MYGYSTDGQRFLGQHSGRASAIEAALRAFPDAQQVFTGKYTNVGMADYLTGIADTAITCAREAHLDLHPRSRFLSENDILEHELEELEKRLLGEFQQWLNDYRFCPREQSVCDIREHDTNQTIFSCVGRRLGPLTPVAMPVSFVAGAL